MTLPLRLVLLAAGLVLFAVLHSLLAATAARARGGLAVVLPLVQGAAVVLFLVALRPLDLGHFIGLRQLRGHLHERGGLQTGGAYALCRHPLYLAMCVFVTAAPRMDARGLVVALWLWAYAYLGARVEERKLLAQFADAYRRYCTTTPRLVPRPPRRRRVVDPMTRREENR